jgi:phosphoglycerol transferase MdoB-like AlkP superfamily enzyme
MFWERLAVWLLDRGYDVAFLYGGYDYFDNLNYFFANNDYRVIDRTAIDSHDIHHETIWGVADENLFTLALREMDRSKREGGNARPVFMHILTTSNHRPYTYPAGRIDIPSGTGRSGAVKYTDYAVGHFIDEAKKHAWFADTVFLITADHGASARGTTQIPVLKYRIPLLVHSPAHVPAGRFERLMSQIDIGPTLLGLLDMGYSSKFFGHDVFKVPPAEDRALVGNYQTLGYMKDGRLVTPQPQKKSSVAAMPADPCRRRRASLTRNPRRGDQPLPGGRVRLRHGLQKHEAHGSTATRAASAAPGAAALNAPAAPR